MTSNMTFNSFYAFQEALIETNKLRLLANHPGVGGNMMYLQRGIMSRSALTLSGIRNASTWAVLSEHIVFNID